jgi:hypothetical protein
MKRRMFSIKNLELHFLHAVLISFSLFSQKIEAHSSSLIIEEGHLSSKPLQEVAAIGAPVTGSLVEGMVGSIKKGCRHRFYCHSASPQQGFIGPQAIAKPLSIKDQPGVFPAPLMGPASLTFNFSCQNRDLFLTPIVVKPDGTIFQGLPMTMGNSPQTLVISSPAQTGIYTLFVLAHQKGTQGAEVTVDATISTQPQENQTFHLRPFDLNSQDASLISAEFVYTPQSF